MKKSAVEDTRTRLIGGPYQAPGLGETLTCRVRGRIAVVGLTKAPIPWPYGSAPGGKRSLIVCEDLARAIRIESSAAVAHHWGVSRTMVMRWRRALGITRMNPGTLALWSRLWPRRLGVEGARKGGLATKGIPKRRQEGGRVS